MHGLWGEAKPQFQSLNLSLDWNCGLVPSCLYAMDHWFGQNGNPECSKEERGKHEMGGNTTLSAQFHKVISSLPGCGICTSSNSLTGGRFQMQMLRKNIFFLIFNHAHTKSRLDPGQSLFPKRFWQSWWNVSGVFSVEKQTIDVNPVWIVSNPQCGSQLLCVD